MPLDQALLDILACPEDKGPLYYVTGDAIGASATGGGEYLYNPRLKRRYDVRDGIPVMLIAESTTIDDIEHSRVMALIAERGLAPTFVV